mgnify:CR=1 FL=1
MLVILAVCLVIMHRRRNDPAFERKEPAHIVALRKLDQYRGSKMWVPEKQKERYLTFVDDYLNFIGEIPQSHYRKELDNVYRKAQKALGRDVVAADEEMSEKDYARERRKLIKSEKKAEKK